MKKVLKIMLVAFMMFGIMACQSKSGIASTLEEKGYVVRRQEQFKQIQRSVNLISSDQKTVITGHFNLDKSLIGIGYGEDGQYYYSSELVEMGLTSDDTLKSHYENWLKEMDTDEESLKDYLVSINKETREPTDLQSIIDEVEFDAELKGDVDSRYDDDLYFESAIEGVFMDAFIKDGKIVTFTFANEAIGANKLFVYTNNKVFKDDGVGGYIVFLNKLNITHEEFMGWIESVYSNNKS